ncbi:ferritin-like domain-containing protein [Sphingomonas sp. RP10(2022)]|uniref:Ferritin-like domain-containing protein n=1 Tax=Sphingomonas liriopis TaxID=2949094 RepID=A0A9X2KRG6_9SPHN|nr:ferritin-like domain-containing protein [Sphingomonas liriopis]MCP3736032.1 ferritin-like domain-containing protein [Sphingomonas liriopis]
MTDLPTDTVLDAIAARRAERRNFLRYAGGAAASAGTLSLLAACGGDNGTATPTPTPSATATSIAADGDVLNFALNLEYLEAQFYSFAAFGQALAAGLTTGVGTAGTVTGGAQVPFSDPLVAQYAREIALDEAQHVTFLRTVLGSAAVAMPAINIAGDATGAFTAAARAAGVVGPSGTFNPYADDVSFLLGAYLFEDVGVSAYKGAAPVLGNKTYIEAAAGILAAESYHAGLIRSVLYRKGIDANTILTNARLISDARDTLDGGTDIDQGIGDATTANIVPTDTNGIVYSRSTGQVLNVVYLNKAAVGSGGFFPSGINGNIRTSAASG